MLALISGCTKTPPPDEAIKDLSLFPQNAQTYVHNALNHTSLLTRQQHYDGVYFEPWNYTKPPFEKEEILWPFASYTSDKSFGENLQPINEAWFEQMRSNGNYESYGTLNKKAVSLTYLDLRNFPTRRPVLKDPKIAGEGFPFDYMQNSGIHANEPLFVSHLSKDGEWAYVFTSYATGWVPLRDIAYINDKVAGEWQKARQIELISDHYPIKDYKGDFVFHSRIGMRLALISIKQEEYVALAITAGKNHTATYSKVHIPRNLASETTLLLNQKNLESIANIMLQSNYGWGGLYAQRDCSSMLRDLYSPFGIWLPRNSSQQAKVGRVISFEGLSNDEKRQKIKAEAVPFETLLYKQGHILLYLGEYEGKITVMHNVWGIKTLRNGVSGRKVIGKTIISSLDLGSSQKDYDENAGIVSQLLSMNIITQEN